MLLISADCFCFLIENIVWFFNLSLPFIHFWCIETHWCIFIHSSLRSFSSIPLDAKLNIKVYKNSFIFSLPSVCKKKKKKERKIREDGGKNVNNSMGGWIFIVNIWFLLHSQKWSAIRRASIWNNDTQMNICTVLYVNIFVDPLLSNNFA